MVISLDTPYPSSFHHILAELERLDLLIRIQVWRLRQARQTDENLSALYIPEDEIDELLEREVGVPLWTMTPLPVERVQDFQERLAHMISVVAQRKAATERAGLLLRLDELARLFGLTAVEQDILLICLAPEIDLRYGRLYAYLQDNINRKHASVNLVLTLLFSYIEDKTQAYHRLTPGTALRYYELLHLQREPAPVSSAWLDQTLTVDERIVRYLFEGDEPDGRLTPYIEVITPTITLDSLRLPDAFVPRLGRLTQQYQTLILYFQGVTGVGKETTARALCHSLNQKLLVVNGRYLLSRVKPEAFETWVRLIDREARLQGAALYWEGFDGLLADDKLAQRQAVLKLLADRPGLTFLAGNTPWEPNDVQGHTPYIRLQFPKPGYGERTHLWQQMLAEETADTAALANKFRFSAGQIHNTVTTARNLARWRNPEFPHIETADLYAASRLQSNRKLAELAQKIEPHYTWEDIILPEEHMAQLRQICAQVQHRSRVYDEWGFGQKLAMGKGLNALFAGPPGTGKTMAADIIAYELALDLYKIDLSTIVSKYIGETEKNLSRIFDEAETSNAILFFDEADAMFGKRTEVRDSHDRYANLEVSYLLQKMEAYEGVVILATNLHKNMDDAFVRRMHFIVEFPFPTVAERRLIWEHIWPRDLPRDADLPLDFMAEKVAVAGGNIRNIALSAAFLAAAAEQPVTMTHLIKATRGEYQKIGKLLTGKEFAQYQENLEVADALSSSRRNGR